MHRLQGEGDFGSKESGPASRDTCRPGGDSLNSRRAQHFRSLTDEPIRWWSTDRRNGFNIIIRIDHPFLPTTSAPNSALNICHIRSSQ